MIEVVLLAIALAMDAFAVSIGLGAKSQKQSQQYVRHLAIYAALYFGIAQGVMPFIGYLLGAALLGWLALNCIDFQLLDQSMSYIHHKGEHYSDRMEKIPLA